MSWLHPTQLHTPTQTLLYFIHINPSRALIGPAASPLCKRRFNRPITGHRAPRGQAAARAPNQLETHLQNPLNISRKCLA